jgi:hypothetical protein
VLRTWTSSTTLFVTLDGVADTPQMRFVRRAECPRRENATNIMADGGKSKDFFISSLIPLLILKPLHSLSDYIRCPPRFSQGQENLHLQRRLVAVVCFLLNALVSDT